MPSQSHASSVFSVKPSFKFHAANYIPQRVNNAIPKGEFLNYFLHAQMLSMNTVEENRRIRLGMLVKKFDGMANLCEKLGYARTDTAALTRILNANPRKERDDKPYEMGSKTARMIEKKLGLTKGLMDNPPTYAELDRGDDPRISAIIAMESMPDEEIPQVLRFINAVAKPPKEAANG